MGIKSLEIRTERLKTMNAAYFCSLSPSPEEDATKELRAWANTSELLSKRGLRLFGRNTYPTDKHSPRGYEFYLTIGPERCDYPDIEIDQIPGGLYAVLRFKSLENIGFAWKKLWNWIENSGYEHVGWLRGKHGWVGGFEEQVNWQDQKPPTEWVFDLWVQLKE